MDSHNIEVNAYYFLQYFNGEKEYMLRLYDGENQHYQDRDVICIEEKHTGRYFTGIITRLQYFLYFDQVFEAIDYRKFGPEPQSKADAIEIYERNPDFQQARELGVITFRITRVSDIIE